MTQKKHPINDTQLLPLYKLMILYLLNKVDFPLSYGQISDFMLGKEYTIYFHLQEALADLLTDNLIYSEQEQQKTIYHLTADGSQMISFFAQNISPDIRKDMDTYLAENNYALKNESAVKATYYRNTNHEYAVHCQAFEKNLPLIDLTLTVPTESEAITIAERWRAHNETIYADIMAKLLS